MDLFALFAPFKAAIWAKFWKNNSLVKSANLKDSSSSFFHMKIQQRTFVKSPFPFECTMSRRLHLTFVKNLKAIVPLKVASRDYHAFNPFRPN